MTSPEIYTPSCTCNTNLLLTVSQSPYFVTYLVELSARRFWYKMKEQYWPVNREVEESFKKEDMSSYLNTVSVKS